MRHLLIVCIFLCSGLAIGQTPASPQLSTAAPPQIVPWQKEMALNISGDKAVYPQIAQIAHVEGCVYVRFEISTDGSTKKVTTLGGPALMLRSAFESALTWKFKATAQEVTTIAPVCYFLRGDDPRKLLEAYQKAADKHSQDSRKLTALGHELLLVGMPDDAENHFQRALSISPSDPDAEFGLGDSLAAKGDLNGAIAVYRQGLAATPKDAAARLRFANLLHINGDLNGAVAQYQTLLQTEPHNGPYHSSLASVLLQEGKVDDAIEEIQKAMHYGAESPVFHYQLGQAYEKKGDVTDALKEYEIAMKARPQNAEFRDAYNRLSEKQH